MYETILPSSFRDPSGFLFLHNNAICRQVNGNYKEHYYFLMNSGLYETLVKSELLIPHEETAAEAPLPSLAFIIIKPEPLKFISYPYEWCFSQLKDAALTTLKIQKTSLEYEMTLKDASAYNIQFRNGHPVMIDTLSFEKYNEGDLWVAYRQFCQHFLAPLALMSRKDVRLNQLLRIYLDGIPLDLASSLLPLSTRFSFSLLSHIHLHAKSQKFYSDKRNAKVLAKKMSRFSFLALIDNLESTVRAMKWEASGTEWANYYDENNNYSTVSLRHKKQLVDEFLSALNPETVWDLGANTGIFSRSENVMSRQIIAFDIDPAAVERNYLHCTETKEKNILPLVLDLTNPGPAIGWENNERMSWMERGPADVVMALALIHHLAISNNVPLRKIAELFHKICRHGLIVEFVPKSDSQVQKLLATRKDIFTGYTQGIFEETMGSFFIIEKSAPVKHSERTLYLMRKR